MRAKFKVGDYVKLELRKGTPVGKVVKIESDDGVEWCKVAYLSHWPGFDCWDPAQSISKLTPEEITLYLLTIDPVERVV